MADDERVTLRLPKDDLELLDKLVGAHIFGSRSEAIRQAISELFKQRAKEFHDRMTARQTIAEGSAAFESLQAQLEQNREARTDPAKSGTNPMHRLERR
jgi:Arc/MetJ-type ribon-helix-helix transcriptional regulator